MLVAKNREEQKKLWWKIQRMQAGDAILAIQEELAAGTSFPEEVLSEEPKVVGHHMVQCVRYSGERDNLRKYAEEMVASGIVQTVKERKGSLNYEFLFPMDGSELVLLSAWESWEDLRDHFLSPTMDQIAELLKKYELSMTVERFRPVCAKAEY